MFSYSIKHKREFRSVLPDFLDTERENPGYCVGCFCDLFIKKFTGFGGVIASRSTPVESFLMTSMTDEILHFQMIRT